MVLCFGLVQLLLEMSLHHGQVFQVCDLSLQLDGDVLFRGRGWCCEACDCLLDLSWQRRHVCFEHLMEIWLWRFFGSNAKVLKLVLEVAGHTTPYQEFSGFLLKLVLLQWLQLSQSWWRLEPCSLSRCLCFPRPSLSFSLARAALGDFEDRPPCATHAASRVRPELVLPDPVRAQALSACDIAPAP